MSFAALPVDNNMMKSTLFPGVQPVVSESTGKRQYHDTEAGQQIRRDYKWPNDINPKDYVFGARAHDAVRQDAKTSDMLAMVTVTDEDLLKSTPYSSQMSHHI